MKKTFIVILSAQFIVILILAVFSLVQITEAKKQQALAEAQTELAIVNAKVASQQTVIANETQVELEKCRKKGQ